ncbi:phosphodiester glycosidase family protein [Streptomyces polyrhachis]|uniref:Phosphodiester glycosidase family protein n=1 Tax=Streptomyces polyrhachis TaxID=1282885 RepID=A0ABW2G790_9ACTN
MQGQSHHAGRRTSRAALISVAAALALTALPSTPAAPRALAAVPTAIVHGDGIGLDSTSRPVAPGVELTSFERLESDKWLRADALSVDLGGSARVDYLADKVSDRETVADLAEAHDPGEGRRTVAALNADFFDINETGAPLGPGLDNGQVTHSPSAGAEEAVGIGAATAEGSAGRLLKLYFQGTLTLPGGPHPLQALNAANVPAGGIGAYTSQWGSADRALTVDGASRTTEVTVRDGRVATVSATPATGPIPADTTVLLGDDAGADTLAALNPGDPVAMEYRPVTDGGEVPRTAVGGRGVLVLDGVAQNWEGRPNNASAARTAVGFSRDGRTMHVLTVDGRSGDTGGVTLTELALMMKQLGAHSALNLDGGGSSTLLARAPGSDTPRLENTPSDGFERVVPNGLAITAPDGSGTLKGFWLTPTADPARAPSADQVPGGHPDRVFPGLHRALTAAGHDETYGPADGTPADWTSSDPGVGAVDSGGLFTARSGGTAEITAHRGAAKGTTTLTVLGALDRVRPSSERVGLKDPHDTGGFGLVGWDAAGDSAPIDPADVHLDYDRDLFTLTPDPAAGGFTVRARTAQPFASGQVTATVQGRSTALAVTVGLHEQSVAAFDDAAQWTYTTARASGSVAPEPQGHEGQGLRMAYDFTQSTATRALYAVPPAEIPVPGQPRSFGLWVKSDGKGAWPSLHLKDAAGVTQVLRAPYLTEPGWQQLTFEVPRGIAYPLRVVRFYLAETVPAHQYSSEVVIDELTAQTPPDADLPPQPTVADPLITTAADVQGRAWRYAVMSDAQFVSREPDSDLVRAARRTLREIKAAHPDFLVVNGDLVDEGSPADLDLAHRILDEELGDELPWTYVPGNHEVMGGRIENFVAEFGAPQRTFDHKGTRFVTLDTSRLTLRSGGYPQIQELRRQLDTAAADPAVSSVTVIAHVPPRDPTPQKGSQLGDRKEADLLEDWLGDFRRRTGKGALFIGAHVGTFHAERVEGVPYLVNGNSGKNPATPPDRGGFTGWSLIGVDPVSAGQRLAARLRPWSGGPDWVDVQTRAHVDALTLDAPARLRAGATGQVTATVLQDARRVPVAWPLSADWTGTPNLWIGPARTAPAGSAAAYDPATGTLTGLRPGSGTLTVTVNGIPTAAQVTVYR